jgi:hypothetical protein
VISVTSSAAQATEAERRSATTPRAIVPFFVSIPHSLLNPQYKETVDMLQADTGWTLKTKRALMAGWVGQPVASGLLGELGYRG